MTDATAAALRKGRMKLLLVGAVFLVPFLIALALTLAGWQPTAKGNGLPILPQRNFAQEQLPIHMASGGDWAWRDVKPRLTLIALPGPDCADRCYAALTALAKARVMLNQNQSRLRLLYVGTPPSGADAKGMASFWQVGSDVDDKLGAWRPSAPDSLGAVLVESDGTALARYPDGFDPAGVLRDLRKVIR